MNGILKFSQFRKPTLINVGFEIDWDEGFLTSIPQWITHRATMAEPERVKCPFLDTINRNVLDFDAEKVRKLI